MVKNIYQSFFSLFLSHEQNHNNHETQTFIYGIGNIMQLYVHMGITSSSKIQR